MPPEASQTFDYGILKNNQPIQVLLFLANVRNGVWVFGIPSLLFGFTDRGIAALADGYLSAVELLQLFTASFLFISWLYLKPEKSWNSDSDSSITLQTDSLQSNQLHEIYWYTTQARMVELQEQHLISQEYVLPFPYLCQIYHLLNLKHLETVHSFSLGNLKVIKVSHFQNTEIGGTIKFQTILDSPINALRVWRQPVVEVNLTLHNPYTVELSIPVYGDKHIIVLFNVLPLSPTEHQFFVSIYSNLGWPKPLLQLLLHFASCLTLFEDLPYLQKLAERNIDRLANPTRVSRHETMWLFKRFVDLYGSGLKPTPSLKASAVE